jgi:hypothetical protein
MNSTTYQVILQLSTTGTLGAQLGVVGDKAATADSKIQSISHSGREAARVLSHMGERVGGMLESVADKAFSVAESLAKWGLAGGVALAAYGVGHLNRELEGTTISLAAIAQAQGFTSTFDAGFRLAGEQVAKMKQDVKTLPGDLGQLSNMMKMIATPAAQGGASMDQIRTMAGKTMLTAEILGVRQDMAAREMANLMAGRAGAHNILGGRLGLIGDEAKHFNALAPEARLARINAEMAKYPGAADMFGQSFVANWTTLKDNIKYVLIAPVTAPLFEHVKITMAQINTYFDEHQEKISHIVDLVGNRLAGAWDATIGKLKEIWPIVASIGEHIARMDASKMLMGAEHAGEALLGVKLGGMAISAGAGLIPYLAASGGSGVYSGTMAGAAAGGGAGAAIGAVATGLGALAVAAVPVAGIIDTLTDNTNKFHTEAEGLKIAIGLQASTIAENLTPALDKASGAMHTFVDWLGVVALKGANFGLRQLANLTDPLKDVDYGHLGGYSPADLALKSFYTRRNDEDDPHRDREVDLFNRADSMLAHSGVLNMLDKVDEKHKPPKGGNTYISKVEINVTSNQDPSRVARLTVAQIEKLSGQAKSSKFVPRYDASNHY